MKKWFILLFFVFFISGVFAECSDGQIDINSASVSELDKITYVGPATADKIIAARPFETVDSLINVNGIGEVKLQAIKDEGLACVSTEKEVDNVNESEVKEEEPEKNEKEEESENSIEVVEEKKIEDVEGEVIKLNTQSIKSDENTEETSKAGKYAINGLIVFCIILALLSLGKKIKRKPERNEFDE